MLSKKKSQVTEIKTLQKERGSVNNNSNVAMDNKNNSNRHSLPPNMMPYNDKTYHHSSNENITSSARSSISSGS